MNQEKTSQRLAHNQYSVYGTPRHYIWCAPTQKKGLTDSPAAAQKGGLQ